MTTPWSRSPGATGSGQVVDVQRGHRAGPRRGGRPAPDDDAAAGLRLGRRARYRAADLARDPAPAPGRAPQHAGGAESDELDGLVLLDLPDHDSTELEHRLIVDRLVELVDMMIWVVDPQKYADAALHNRYLRPLAPHSHVMVFALNHSDKLTPVERDRCVADFDAAAARRRHRRPDVLATSAVTGVGLEDAARPAGQAGAATRRPRATGSPPTWTGSPTGWPRSAARRRRPPRSAKSQIDGPGRTRCRTRAGADGGGRGTSLVPAAVPGPATGWPVTKWLVAVPPATRCAGCIWTVTRGRQQGGVPGRAGHDVTGHRCRPRHRSSGRRSTPRSATSPRRPPTGCPGRGPTRSGPRSGSGRSRSPTSWTPRSHGPTSASTANRAGGP